MGIDTAGAGIVDTVNQAAQDLDNPEDWAMDGLALGLDALGFVANPLGGLLSAGIGWLIEHLDFLREPLDDLAGDPAAINRIAATWGEDVRKEVAEVADQYRKAVKSEIPSWEGDAADQYRKSAEQLAAQIGSLDGASTAVSQAVQGSGMLVATVRGIIRDLIAEVVSEIVLAAAAALASSWFTLGGSIAAFTGWAVARGAATAGKIAGKISKLLTKLANILSKFAKLRGAVQALGKLAKRFGDTAKTLGRTAARNGSALRRVEDTVGGWNSAITGKLPQGVRNFADGVDDLMTKRPRDGFADTFSPGNMARVGGYGYAKENAQADENYDKAVQENEQNQ
ncbi:WXG100 family type VII secretion target [Amycolatopsis cihanbeyliensis]|uniref:PPE family protein n=1 Tax=Amycolatopsis cihanbeyliensis TaxID=1128664 RepID=A0A542CTM7_AMYCI|nr:hypothetical protein [Amycolatopsis cihanbeyliensis]TQI94179.1 hypothetical protein FB471_6337 [Amycolatopsis cihanbeyliensis]